MKIRYKLHLNNGEVIEHYVVTDDGEKDIDEELLNEDWMVLSRIYDEGDRTTFIRTNCIDYAERRVIEKSEVDFE